MYIVYTHFMLKRSKPIQRVIKFQFDIIFILRVTYFETQVGMSEHNYLFPSLLNATREIVTDAHFN